MSSAIDEDTARTINQGRATVGAALSQIQTHLQKVFIVFVIGLVGTIMVLRLYVWTWLQNVAKSQMRAEVVDNFDIITRTPFDVILVQVKIGLFVGIVLAVPVLIFLSRDELRERGFTSAVPVSRAKVAAFGLLSVLLFAGGVVYAYSVFFPVMFNFLATNAINAAIKPSWDIVMWVQFLIILTVSFGFAAQLPLVMSLLSYTEVVPYETFRDNWKYAIIAIFSFGAVFSPPDPFTQIMWAIPLCGLYLFSLGLAKLVTNVRRAGETDPTAMTVREAGYYLAGLYVAATAGFAAFATQGGFEWVNTRVLPRIPARVTAGPWSLAGTSAGPWSIGIRPGPLSVESLLGIPGDLGVAVFSVAGGLLVVAVVVFAFMMKVLNEPVVPRPGPGGTAAAGDGEGRGYDPTAINLSELDADGVRAAPAEAFAEMTEDQALELAQEAIDDDQRPKARAILDRFDEAQSGDAGGIDLRELDAEAVRAAPLETFADMSEDEALSVAQAAIDADDRPKARAVLDRWDEAQEADLDDGEDLEEATAEPSHRREDDEDSDVVTSTAAGVADAFTEEETDEEDIGGYYYDLTFILESLTSKAFRIVAVFLITMGGSFAWLYSGGLGTIKSTFFGRIDPAVLAAAAQGTGTNPDPAAANYVIALHPVEQLIFEVKVSVVIGALFAVPMTLYYAYPAMRERGLTVGGDRRVFLVWGGSLIGAATAGFLLGFFYVAPTLISFLVEDALAAGPDGFVISYRLNAFMWLVILTTAGIGLLADIPVSMLLFHYGGLVSFESMHRAWRVVVLVVFAVAGFFLPGGVLTMLIISIPISAAYLLGLGVLWLVTLPGRLRGGGGDEADPEEATAV